MRLGSSPPRRSALHESGGEYGPPSERGQEPFLEPRFDGPKILSRNSKHFGRFPLGKIADKSELVHLAKFRGQAFHIDFRLEHHPFVKVVGGVFRCLVIRETMRIERQEPKRAAKAISRNVARDAQQIRFKVPGGVVTIARGRPKSFGESILHGVADVRDGDHGPHRGADPTDKSAVHELEGFGLAVSKRGQEVWVRSKDGHDR